MMEHAFEMLSIEASNDESIQFESMVKKHIETQIDIITKKMIEAAESGASRLIYNELNGFLPIVYLVRKWRYGSKNIVASFMDNNYKRCIVGELVVELEKLFTGIAITVNLERVYMLIDWS
jgi:hypothetical protein